ncbi:MAG: CRTAC1 family protein [Acidobacteria bacterium]|nr:CRTAC1 family protein [Acidobacteriota bacterium]
MRTPVLLLLATLLLAGGCSAMPPEPSAGQDVRAEFEEMCQTQTDSGEPFRGKKLMREAQALLKAGLPGPREELSARMVLGRELLEQGRTQEAIRMLSETLSRSESGELDPDMRVDIMGALAMAHLLAAEDANCVKHNTAESCIFPISGGGVHRNPQEARLAGDLYLKILRERPNDIQAAWLLNLTRTLSDDFPDGVPEEFRLDSKTFTSEAPFPRWTDRAPDLGLDIVDLAGGAVMDDFDGDGFLDIISSTADPCGSPQAFRNDGHGGLQNVTVAWGLDEQSGGLNMMHADYDNDGRLDLLILRGGWLFEHGRLRNSLLHNELDGPAGRFVDVTHQAGLAEPAYPTQTAAWADFDGDGLLDVYIGNEEVKGQAFPSQLFHNNGDGTFTDVAAAAGVANLRFTKGVAWGDFDDDGDPDLYVSNIDPNRLFRNNGDGTFTDVADPMGVIGPPGRSFATWFFDFDNDGDLDLFVVDYNSPVVKVSASYFGLKESGGQPFLYRNEGGRFQEVSRQVGLWRPVIPMGSNYGDLDNDGWLDIYLGTGDPGYDTLHPDIMLHNENGLRFRDITYAGGFGFLQKGHGVAFGDIDNDGDQDLFHQLGGFYPGDGFRNALLENPGTENDWLTLRLEGRTANHFGVGARIEVRTQRQGTKRTVHLLAGSGGSFGGSSMQQEIGLGRIDGIEEIVIHWPGSGTVQRFSDVEPNRIYRVVEDQDRLIPLELPVVHLAGSSVN